MDQSQVLISRTAYNLFDCEDLCTRELRSPDHRLFHRRLLPNIFSFRCLGFSFRQPLSAGEIDNCDLTDRDLSTLDRYSSRDFREDTRYDFYQRSGGGEECEDSASGQGKDRILSDEYVRL